MGEVTVKVVGRAGSGKSTILDLIYKTLIENGFAVEIDPEETEEFVQMAPHMEQRRRAIKQSSVIKLEAVQLNRTAVTS